MESLPLPVRTALWSYDTERLDITKDKTLIIRGVLASGTYEAVRWLRSTYQEHEIEDAFRTSVASAWSPKTLRFWSLILNTTPHTPQRIPAQSL